MHRILIIIFLLSNTLLIAQKQGDAEVVEYELIDDNPNFIAASGNVNFLSGNVNAYNMSLYTGVGGTVIYKRLLLNWTYDFTYFNHMEDYAITTINPEFDDLSGFSIYQAPLMARSFDAVFSYKMIQNTFEDDVYILLKSESTGYKEITNTVTKVKALNSRPITLDLGLKTGFTFYNVGDNGVDVIDVLGESKSFSTSNRLKSIFDYTNLVLGVSKMRLTNVTIKTKKYGVSKNRSANRLYGHLLLLIRSNLDDVYARDYGTEQAATFFGLDSGTGYSQYSIDTQMLPIGVRVGYEKMNTSRFAIVLGVEAGFIPGPLVNGPIHNFYFQLKTGISFGGMIK